MAPLLGTERRPLLVTAVPFAQLGRGRQAENVSFARGDPRVKTIAAAEQRTLDGHGARPDGEAVGVADPAAQLRHPAAIDRRLLQHPPFDDAGRSRDRHLVLEVAERPENGAHARDVVDLDAVAGRRFDPARAGAPIADAAFVDQSSVRVERRRTAGDDPLAAAKDLAPEEHDEIPQHRAERERRAGLDPEPAHPDVQNRVALSPAPFDLDEADGEGDVGGRRQPRRSGGTPGGRRLQDELRAAIGSRSEQTSHVELVSTVGEIDHGARRVLAGSSAPARGRARDFHYCG